MNREYLIGKLRNRLEFLNRLLVKEYNSRNLKNFLEVEKEIQVQTMYLKHESKGV